MPSLGQRQLIASPTEQTLPDAEPTSAPSDAELRGALPPISKPVDPARPSEGTDDSKSGGNAKEVEDAVLRWFPVFLGGWGLMIIFLRYL